MYEIRMKTGRSMQIFYPFSNFRGFMPEKLNLFLDFANSRLPVTKIPFLRVKGSSMDVRFGAGPSAVQIE